MTPLIWPLSDLWVDLQLGVRNRTCAAYVVESRLPDSYPILSPVGQMISLHVTREVALTRLEVGKMPKYVAIWGT